MEIKELVLFSANLKDQITFYHEVIGLDIYEQTNEHIAFKVGKSILKIVL